MDILIVVGRVMFGAYFSMMGVMHFKNAKMLNEYAASKGVPMPSVAVMVTGLVLLIGGLGVVLNLNTQNALLLIALFLLVITPQMHAFWKETDPAKKMTEKQTFLKNMALLGAALAMLAL